MAVRREACHRIAASVCRTSKNTLCIEKNGALRPILCAEIRPSIGTENLIPEEVNYTKITIRMTVMNKVQFLMASEPRKPLKPRSLYVIFLVKKDVSVKRRRTCDYHHHKKI